MAETEPHINVDYVLNRTIGMIDEKLETGHSKRQIREDLAGMGFDADTANALIEQVDGPRRHELRLQGMQHCAGGLAMALLGGAITLGTWFWASPGGTYFVSYGMMAVGGFYALVGAFRSLINTSGPASFVRWAAGDALVFGLLGTGAFLLYGWTINAPPEAPPPDSKVLWIPNEVHIDPNTNLKAVFGGSVSNFDSEWSIKMRPSG